MGIYPIAVDLAFFMPLDLSFSVCAFYIHWKLQEALGSALGMPHEFPYASQQSFDTYIAIGLIACWSTRKHLVQISRKFINSRSPPDDDSTKPLSYRGTVILLLLILAYLFGFYLKAGMSAWVIFVFFAMYLTLATGITRMRSELGSRVHDQHFAR